jgi:hypothetical protein
MVTDMPNGNESPCLLTVDDLGRQIKAGSKISNCQRKWLKGSIRELELMAANFRSEGDNRGADEVDDEIMNLLDRKICRKIIKRSRKEQKWNYFKGGSARLG